MARDNVRNDPRTDSLKIDMAGGWEEHEDEYRDGVNYEGSEVVYEDGDLAIVADYTGHALNEYLQNHDVPRRVVSNWMHAVAEQKMGEQEAHELFSHADPIVFDKFVGGDA